MIDPHHELQLAGQGYLVGIDEVGRGCLAGPVVAAAFAANAATFKAFLDLPAAQLSCVRDSKTLSQRQRAQTLQVLKSLPGAHMCLAAATVEEVDAHGIAQATFLAMRRAHAKLPPHAEGLVLVDGKFPIPDFTPAQRAVIGGDNRFLCLAAASIIAKQARDLWMQQVSVHFPAYGFAQHVGYGTKQHLSALDTYGPTALHRFSFAPVRKAQEAHALKKAQKQSWKGAERSVDGPARSC